MNGKINVSYQVFRMLDFDLKCLLCNTARMLRFLSQYPYKMVFDHHFDDSYLVYSVSRTNRREEKEFE